MRLRLARNQSAPSAGQPWADFDDIFLQRRSEADDFYGGLQQAITDADVKLVQRQAFAGLIWGKQFFHYEVPVWLAGDPTQPPPPPERKHGRNADWTHLNNADVISMPDKWEYPWFAAWDWAFHCVALVEIDAEFAKSQLVLVMREWYMHPNGQLPAYEWAFGDVNPPVHAWSVFRVFQIDRRQRRETNPADTGDLVFLERVFQKLLLNFTWWVNRKDEQGRNIFQGGFLGLDNIGVFDRSQSLPTGGFMSQADGTSWMAMYCLNLLRIALELAQHNHVYEDIATKFFEHFLSIAAAINGVGDDKLGLWDEADQFYYDHLNLPDGANVPMKIQSAVGLIPLLAVEVLDPGVLNQLPQFTARMEWYLQHRPQLADSHLRLERLRRWRPQTAFAAARSSHEGPAPAHARRNPVSFQPGRAVTFKIPRATSVWLHHRRTNLHGQLLAGRIAQRSVRRQFQLAWTNLDAVEFSHHRVAPKISLLLR